MRVWAISDLHLSFSERFCEGAVTAEHHPMSIFGAVWQQHYAKIFAAWQQQVAAEDIVLLPGDLSWAMRLEDCGNDFDFLSRLAGQLVLCRGNHDYWWQSYSKVCAALPANVRALQNNAVVCGGKAICATRGWLCPGANDFSAADEKIYKREVLRLELTLAAAAKLELPIVLMTHYRPTNEQHAKNEMIELLQAYRVERVIYGHLHGVDVIRPLPEQIFDLQFNLVSADYLNFTPLLLWEDK